MCWENGGKLFSLFYCTDSEKHDNTKAPVYLDWLPMTGGPGASETGKPGVGTGRYRVQ
jgi:hypothetical protein